MNFKLKLLTHILLVPFTIVVNSCNGQVKSDKKFDQLTFTSQNALLVKTQGSNEHQNIHCSLQDKNGNLWFGTTGEGVYKYDGKLFTQYTIKDGLSDNSIWSILEDRSGNIWFGTNDGLSRYDGKTISKVDFIPNILNLPLPEFPKNAVWSMMQDKKGTIWVGTNEDLYCYDGKTFRRFLDNDSIVNQGKLELKWIQCMYEDSNGTIWMGSGPMAMEGVIRIDGKTITSSKPNGDGWIRKIIADKNSNIWFSGRSNGIFYYNGNEFVDFKDKKDIGSALLKDSAGNIWFDGGEKQNTIESNDGLWIYDGKTFKNINFQDTFIHYSVWSIMEDSNGYIWIGTRNCGLYRYDGKECVRFFE